jgi:hypothetical protein
MINFRKKQVKEKGFKKYIKKAAIKWAAFNL